MAKSSIHIQAGKIGFFSHNSREKKTVNAIFNDESNYISCDNKTAIEKFRSELKIRTSKYLQNHPTRTKLHSKTLTHLSAIVNFNKNHTPQDMKKVCEHLEKTLDTKVIQFAMHRDEGHINSKSEAIKNYHAHIEFMGLDSEGNSVRRKLTKKYLINLQSEVANILQMERGKNYTQLQEPRPKRLDTYPFKRKKETESKIVKKANEIINSKIEDKKKLKADLEVLKKENLDLRSKLKTRAEFGQQEVLNKELQANLKSGEITLDEALAKIENLEKEIFDSRELNNTLKTQNKALQEQNKVLESKVITLEEKIVSSAFIISRLEQQLKNIISFVNEKIKSLFQFKAYNDYKFKTSDRYKYNQFMNSKKEDYWEELVYDNPELDKHYNENLDSELIKLEDIELIKLDDIDLKESIEDKKSTGIEKESIELKENIKEIKEEVKEDYYQILNR